MDWSKAKNIIKKETRNYLIVSCLLKRLKDALIRHWLIIGTQSKSYS